MKTTIINAVIITLVELLLPGNQAVMAADTGLYLGAGIGRSTHTTDEAEALMKLFGTGFTIEDDKEDEIDLGYKVFGGYKFNSSLAIEAGYFDLGESGYFLQNSPPGTFEAATRLKGINFDLVGMMPFSEQLSGLIRFGGNYAQTNNLFSGTGSTQTSPTRTRERDVDYKYGLGLQYDFTESLAFRAEAEQYRINDAFSEKKGTNFYSAGLVYTFGGSESSPAPRREEPMPVKPAPVDTDGDGVTDNNDRCPNTPRGVAVDSTGCPLDGDGDGVTDANDQCPNTPAGQKVNTVGCHVILSLEGVNFAYNSAALSATAENKLNTAIDMLKGNPAMNIVVEGHTDNVGSDAYNMSLSERRAQSVGNYLVRNGINNNRLIVKGMGENLPVASNDTDAGRAQNRRVDLVTNN